MKTTSILAAIASMLSFGTQSVQAKCFKDGATWPNREVRRPSGAPGTVPGIIC
jgi:hypothetical protein